MSSEFSIPKGEATGYEADAVAEYCCGTYYGWRDKPVPFDPETTVLAHFRLGMKPNDLVAAWACSACHDEADRRTRHLPYESVRAMHAEGVMRTLDALVREGIIDPEAHALADHYRRAWALEQEKKS